jgi:hypothetical protein
MNTVQKQSKLPYNAFGLLIEFRRNVIYHKYETNEH